MTERPAHNPDQSAIVDAIAAVADDGAPVALTSSAALVQYRAQVIAGRAGLLTIRFTVPPGSVQGNGVVGGGAIASVVDLGMALATMSRIEPGSTCSTLSLTVNFLSPLRASEVVVEASVDRAGRRAAFASAEAPATGVTLAVATASMLVH